MSEVSTMQSIIRQKMPEKFCNLSRLLDAMEARNIDGLVATTSNNVFYLSGFNGIAHKSDEPRPYAFVLSRHAPDEPILILADYYVSSVIEQPTWVKDIRAFRAVMMPLDIAAREDDLDRFIPSAAKNETWVKAARESFSPSATAACRKALVDLKLDTGRVAFDELRFGFQLDIGDMTVVDGYDPLMFARAVKSNIEIEKLRAATQLNQLAIEHTVGTWGRGMSWRELNQNYHNKATELGGFVRDPGAMVWGHPRGTDTAIMLQTGLEDFEVAQGSHIMFDCHGTLGLYCWDGGKTWIVDGEPQGDAKRLAQATSAASETVLNAMRPGVRISELQAAGRATFSQHHVPDADAALIFFHGLGLSHMDIEQVRADGSENKDWVLEEGMVVPLHILYPGDEKQRAWVEEIALVTKDGGEAFFSWGFDPISV